MSKVLGIYVDVNGVIHEFYGDTTHIKMEQQKGFVQVNLLEPRSSGETEIVASYVLHKVVNTLSELPKIPKKSNKRKITRKTA